MSGSVFLDTNVLVYAIETGGPTPKKSAVALALVRREHVCLSTQVLGEFYRAVTSRRRAEPLTHAEAVAWVQLWKRHDVRPITMPHVDLARELAGRLRIGYYDALILAAAHLAGCAVVCSEDLGNGQEYGTVRVENPFSQHDPRVPTHASRATRGDARAGLHDRRADAGRDVELGAARAFRRCDRVGRDLAR